jgi:hypothetical protein
MKIIPFPSRRESMPNDAWHIELEAALDGRGEDSAAESWRELHQDIRALAPSMTPEFERQLRERLAEQGTRRRPRTVAPSELPGAGAAASLSPSATPESLGRPRRAFKRLLGRFTWPSPSARLGAGAAALVTTIGVIVAVVIAVPWRAGTPRTAVHARAGQGTPMSAHVSAAEGASRAAGTVPGASAAGAASGEFAAGGVSSASDGTNSAHAGAVSASAAATPNPERVQQLAASINLAAAPDDVQEIAMRVARLAVSDGGFVQSSRVQVQQAGTSEANLMLRLPSARLSAALVSLGGLASVRAENQSLQDITDTYDAARRRVADAIAERQALLRALAKATTEGQIDSLRERLSQARSAIGQARSALQTISQHARTAEVEVAVIGNARAQSEGLTLHRGLHDAGRVLVVTLVVLLIATALLVPLALLVVALATARRAWHRQQRERALDQP